ncbi:MAG: phosphoribosyl-ATP diphosphatase [Deferribacteraceae bacterium]|jgi:phosphoribosyl-ATP pyrophosphohydrolase/phosphoribosyl-ATP pyrophosphohydrolase/phosphoribosyl-AMP cyclohydrolase|nr:phosphoribosyl-ATP diphosphatase [Deferribacteraceae bacterium]
MNLDIIQKLSEIIAERKYNPKEGSYTSSLFAAGDNKIVKKLGEENAEFIRAFFKCNDDELAGEAADYIYHVMVALEYRGVKFAKALDILAERYK